jgi:uncharacterized protein YpmS
MNKLEQILTLVSDRLKATDKKSEAYKTIKTLQKDIKKLIHDDFQNKVNKEIAYHCSICDKIAVSLKDGQYCLDCYQTYVE